MPRIAVFKFLTFYIFAYDSVNEPPHVHIAKEKGNKQKSAKVWLRTLKIATKGSLTEKELNIVLKLIVKYKNELIENFEKVKEGKKIITIKMKQ